jgi:cyanophycinase
MTNGKNTPKGTLIIVGGHEDKEGEKKILKEIARRAQKGRLVITAVASEKPDEHERDYTALFKELGVAHIDVLTIETRDDAKKPESVALVEQADVIFFTGGDQLRITSLTGDSPVFQTLHERYRKGTTIVGTSAGAAVMSGTMITSGESDKSNHVSDLDMAPGLGLIGGVVIDSHFAERGRVGRLMAVVAQNPANLGIGIDEDTAIIVQPDLCFDVIGSGGVYVLDGSTITDTNLSSGHNHIVSAFDVRMHLLSEHSRFDLKTRRPEFVEKQTGA